MKKFLLCIIGILLLTGCISSSIRYKKPESITVENQKFINKPFDKVWKTVSGSFFSSTAQLNNVDRETGTITATFVSNRPVNYVDCGIITRKFKAEKPFQEFIYNKVDSIDYTYDKNGKVYDAKVNSKLTAEITAHVAASGVGTNISIDIDYTIVQETESTYRDGSVEKDKEEIKLSTNKPFRNDEYRCYANGSLETNLLHNMN